MAAHLRIHVHADHWGCYGECEEVNSSSAKKRLELPSLYIYATPQMLRHKLITQPSNLFQVVQFVLGKKTLKGPF